MTSTLLKGNKHRVSSTRDDELITSLMLCELERLSGLVLEPSQRTSQLISEHRLNLETTSLAMFTRCLRSYEVGLKRILGNMAKLSSVHAQYARGSGSHHLFWQLEARNCSTALVKDIWYLSIRAMVREIGSNIRKRMEHQIGIVIHMASGVDERQCRLFVCPFASFLCTR